ncbi:hypothetical protein V6N13_056200 [Hibiscus sabdariffa]
MKGSIRPLINIIVLVALATTLSCWIFIGRRGVLTVVAELGSPRVLNQPPAIPNFNSSLLKFAAIDIGEEKSKLEIDQLLELNFGSLGRYKAYAAWRRFHEHDVKARNSKGLLAMLRSPEFHRHWLDFRGNLHDWATKKMFQPDIMMDLVRLMKVPIDSSNKTYKSCAVVGNSGILLNSHHRKSIDDHEVVIRLNNARIERFEKHVGSKTSISFVNSNVLHLCAMREGCFCHPYGDNVPIVMYICQPVHFADTLLCKSSHRAPLLITDPRFDLLCAKIVKYYSIKRFVEETAGKSLNEWEQAHDGPMFHYSSGLQAVMLALGICDRVSIFGFGKSTSDKHHYHTNQKSELRLHDYEAEYEFYHDLVKNPHAIPFISDKFKFPPVNAEFDLCLTCLILRFGSSRLCLPLEPISLGSQKYTRSGELSRVLGVPLRSSTSDDHSFGVSHPKPSPPVATEELKNFKESVQDTSRKARDRVKRLRESISKLDRYKEALSSKKRQRSDISSERTNGVNITKMVSQIHRNGHDLLTQRLEDRPKSMGLNKRVRTSVADLRADNRTAVNPRQQGTLEKDSDVLPAANGSSARMEEKIRRLPGEGWETKMKRKRSVATVGNRVAGGDRDIKRVMQPKLSSESKLRSCDIQGFRSKSSLGVGGIRKSDGSFEAAGSDASTVPRNELESTSIPRDRAALLEQRVVVKANNKATLQDDNQASGPSTMLKGKVSRAPRTGSIMVLDSSSKVHLSSGALQGWEQPNPNKIQPSGVGSNQKRLMSTGSSSQAMSHWGGQRPHKNSRTRRTILVSPYNAEAQISNQGFATPDLGARASIGTGGSLLGCSVDNANPRIKREPENVSSPFGFSESEESGAGDNKSKEKGIDCSEVTLPTSQKAGSFLLPTRKNRMTTNEIGDGVRRQGRSGGNAPSLTKPGIPPMREKLENISTTKPIQSARSASDKNRSKTGRPPSKKLKDRKATTRVGLIQNIVSSDCTGESEDDRDELFAAATSACNATSLACSGPFWKKMGSIFNPVSSEDSSFLRLQLNLAEGLDESLSQMFGDGYTVLSGVASKDAPSSVEEIAKSNVATGVFDKKQFDKVTPLYQRVLSALIEEDESEEIYHHIEAKNMTLHYASDDSHCGSCNHMDVEPKDRERIESEVESIADFQCQKNSLLDRLSYDASVASNTFRNSSMSNSLHSSERWLGDDEFSHSDMGPVSEICSTDLGQVQPKEISISAVSSLDSQYQFMSMEDKLLLELQSIGLYPENLIQKKKKKLGKIDKAIQNGREVDRRNIEHAAMDQLIQMANKKRLACRGGNSSKSAVRKVSKQVALAFIKRTLDRCRKFEETGNSCFSEPALQDVLFSVQPSSNEAKSVECIGSGTASNTCNEISNHQAEARGSGAVCSTFERYDSPDAIPAVHSSEHGVSKYGSMLNKGRKREVLIDDVVGSASSRVTPALDGTIGGLRGNRSEREREQSRDNLRNVSSVSGAGRASLDGAKGDRRTKSKPKQKSNSGHGFNARLSDPSLPPLANTGKMAEREASNIRPDSSKEADEPVDFANLQLTELDPMEELGVSNDIGGPQDLSSWLNFDEDGLQDHDSIGLEIPMDDLSDLKFAF